MRSLWALISVFYMSCAVQKGSTLCQHKIKVIDVSSLDGCGLLLESSNGERWLPINEPAYEYQAGDVLSISYENAEGMSICMAEKELVRLTCVQYLGAQACKPIGGIYEESWLSALQSKDLPTSIIRYQWRDEYLYEVVLENERSWYNCHGKIICHRGDVCQFDRSTLDGKLIIYTAHH